MKHGAVAGIKHFDIMQHQMKRTINIREIALVIQTFLLWLRSSSDGLAIGKE